MSATRDDAAGEQVEVDLKGSVKESALRLAQEELRLEDEKKRINVDVLEQDVRALKRLEELQSQQFGIQQQYDDCVREMEDMEVKRYTGLKEVLIKINGRIAPIFNCLTGGQGDAYISFTDEKQLLFSEGLYMHVRPDGGSWRTFEQLSGGQQALCTLALCFALQESYPSPVYFFDEIDAALDVHNAARVAQYVLHKTSGQYVIVSHKPQVFEAIPSTIGVYSLNGASAAVTVNLKVEDTTCTPRQHGGSKQCRSSQQAEQRGNGIQEFSQVVWS